MGYDKFFDYVLGKEDGIPKTPKWASEKCGVPSRIIKALAREWAARVTSIAICNGGPMVRGPYSTETARLEVCLLGMQGLGKPGVSQVKMAELGLWSMVPRPCGYENDPATPLPGPMILPNIMAAYRGEDVTFTNQPKQVVPKTRIHDAILNPPISWYSTSLFKPVEEQFVKYTYPAKGCSPIHMIWTDSPCLLTCWNDSNRVAEAYRSPQIEFLLAQHPWMENDCLYADIILPTNTKLEEYDIGHDMYSGQFFTMFPEEKCVESIGESKSDYEAVCVVAEKMGLLKEYTGGKSVDEWVRFGFENSGIQDMISWEEFKEKGYYVIPTDPDWEKYPAGMSEFYNDPEKHPIKTPSGKLEFYSQRLADNFPGG